MSFHRQRMYRINNDKFLEYLNPESSNNRDSEIIMFHNCNAINIVHGIKMPKFIKCKTVIFINNAPKFNYLWLSRIILPNVEHIYFSCSTLHTDVYLRFPKEIWHIEEGSEFFPRTYIFENKKRFKKILENIEDGISETIVVPTNSIQEPKINFFIKGIKALKKYFLNKY